MKRKKNGEDRAKKKHQHQIKELQDLDRVSLVDHQEHYFQDLVDLLYQVVLGDQADHLEVHLGVHLVDHQVLMVGRIGGLRVVDHLEVLECLLGDPLEGLLEVLRHLGEQCPHPGLCQEDLEVQVCRHGDWLHLLEQEMLLNRVNGRNTQHQTAKDIITTGRPKSPFGRNHRS